MISRVCIAVLAAVGAGGSVRADILQLDINALTAQAVDPAWGLAYTGTISVQNNAASTLAAILIEGSNQSFSGSIASLAGSLTLSAGSVTGGALSLTMSEGSSFGATVVPGTGSVHVQVGEGFQVDALMQSGAFNGPTFAGVNVAAWAGNQLPASMLLSSFGPDAAGLDVDTDLELFVDVPAPGSVVLAGVGAWTIIGRRRRA